MKKLMCIALSLLMLLAMVPTAVFANDEVVAEQTAQGNTMTPVMSETDTAKAAEGYAFKNAEGTYYKTLSEAVGGWSKNKNIGTVSLTMIGNVTEANWGISNGDGASMTGTLTIDGNGYKMSGITGSANFLFNWKGGALTLSNLTVEHNGFLNLYMRENQGSSKITVSLTNCDVTVKKYAAILSSNNSLNSYDGEVTVKDSKITMASTATAVGAWYGELHPVSIHGGGAWTITVDNSTLTNQSAYGGTDGKGGSVVKVGPSMNATYSNPADVTLSLVNGAKLVNATSTPTQYLISRTDTNGKLIVSMDETAVLEMNPTANMTAGAFLHAASGVIMEATDNGAAYKLSASAAAPGITMPATTPAREGATFLGWATGSAAVQPGETVTSDEAVTLTPVFCTAEDFLVADGASVRTADPVGIRYSVKISKTLAADLARFGADVSVNAMIAPNAKITDEFTVEAMAEGSYVSADLTEAASKEEDGYLCYYVALVDLPETREAVTMDFAARAYLTVGDVTLYTAFEDAHVRNIAEVAEYFYTNVEEYKDNAVLAQIVALAQDATGGQS